MIHSCMNGRPFVILQSDESLEYFNESDGSENAGHPNLDADLATTSCPILEDDPAVCQGVLEVAPVQ